MVMIRSGLP
jgi:hypothetical protein